MYRPEAKSLEGWGAIFDAFGSHRQLVHIERAVRVSATLCWTCRWGIRTVRVTRNEMLGLAEIGSGDRLLFLDPLVGRDADVALNSESFTIDRIPTIIWTSVVPGF